MPLAEWIEHFRLWILNLGVFGLGVFVLAYIVLTVMMAPVGLLSLMAGLAYGMWGYPLVLASATLGATLAFVLGRYAFRDRVLRRINKDARLSSLHGAVSAEGWRVVGLMRLSPIVPFSLQNYLFSITDIKLGPYILATAIGIMPGSALYVYIGSVGRGLGHTSSIQWVFVGLSVLATALVAWFVAKRAGEILNAEQLKEPQTNP